MAAEATSKSEAVRPPVPGSDEVRTPRLSRALAWTTASAAIVPIGGLVVQPILAHALGAESRGEVSAALAPATLATSVATLGLPEALTYFVARDPRRLRRLLAIAVSISLVLGLACLVLVSALSPLLAGPDGFLQGLMVTAMACSLPLLAVGALRGAAIGAQMYALATAESVVNAVLRVALFSAMSATGTLTPVTAVLTIFGTQLVAAAVYLRPMARLARAAAPESTVKQSFQELVSYGWRIWFGAVASMMLARTAPLIMVPLSSTRELGLYTVMTTISDVPVLAAFAIARAVNGVNSRSADWTRVARSTRITLLATFLGSAVIIGTLHLWLTALFGDDFADAYWPAVLGLSAAVVATPAYVLSAGLSSSGRPGLRAIVYLVAFVTNVVAFVALVPPYGALGGAIASLITGFVLTALMVGVSRSLSTLRVRDLVAVSRADVTLLASGVRKMLGRLPSPSKLLRRRRRGRHSS